jgi:hypothetical protein
VGKRKENVPPVGDIFSLGRGDIFCPLALGASHALRDGVIYYAACDAGQADAAWHGLPALEWLEVVY